MCGNAVGLGKCARQVVDTALLEAVGQDRLFAQHLRLSDDDGVVGAFLLCIRTGCFVGNFVEQSAIDGGVVERLLGMRLLSQTAR